jgi:hypothetical protein
MKAHDSATSSALCTSERRIERRVRNQKRPLVRAERRRANVGRSRRRQRKKQASLMENPAVKHGPEAPAKIRSRDSPRREELKIEE